MNPLDLEFAHLHDEVTGQEEDELSTDVPEYSVDLLLDVVQAEVMRAKRTH